MGRCAAVVVFVALLLVGCGDDDTDAVQSTTSSVATASDTTTTVGSATGSAVRIVSQNLLHGIACAEETGGCLLADRVALFVRQLADAGCPELVSVQEANQQMVDLLAADVASVCDGGYEVVWDGDPGIDREMVLTTAEVIDSRRLPLPGGFRTAYWVRAVVDGVLVDFVSTHLASSSDDRPCDSETCPPPCSNEDRLNTCQARVMLDLIEDLAEPAALVVLGGDLNAAFDSSTIEAILSAGFTDSHLDAGGQECDGETGEQCTSGRDDASLDDLTDPTSLQTERIDYLMIRRPGCRVTDAGLFNGDPAVGDPAGLAFPADHTGVFAALSCESSGSGSLDPTTATLPPTTTTTAPAGAGPADDATVAAVTEAYTAMFDGSVTDAEVKLSYLENGEALRPFFLASYEANLAIASQVSARVDAVTLTGPGEAAVVFALLLDGAVVVGPQDGQAVLVDGRWLVSTRTYCDLSAAGAETIPDPCR